MKQIRLTPAAAHDLDGIWTYTNETWGPNQADLYIDLLQETLLGLAKGERAARDVTIRQGYRKVLAGRHVIYFREDSTALDVMRILHQSMDVDRHL